jgi:hypothetical protein
VTLNFHGVERPPKRYIECRKSKRTRRGNIKRLTKTAASISRILFFVARNATAS